MGCVKVRLAGHRVYSLQEVTDNNLDRSLTISDKEVVDQEGVGWVGRMVKYRVSRRCEIAVVSLNHLIWENQT